MIETTVFDDVVQAVDRAILHAKTNDDKLDLLHILDKFGVEIEESIKS